VVPTWLEEEPKKKISTFEESGVETDGNHQETGVASQG
jgi:hypothetical protein